MKLLLGLLTIIMPAVLMLVGFIVLKRSKGKVIDIRAKLIIALLSVAIGTFIGFAFFIPVYCLLCLIIPIVGRDGHPSMPIAQAMFGGIMSTVAGVIGIIIVYKKIRRWLMNKTSL